MGYVPAIGYPKQQPQSASVPELQVSTQTDVQVVNMGGKDNEKDGRMSMRLGAVIVLAAVALLWLSAYGLRG